MSATENDIQYDTLKKFIAEENWEQILLLLHRLPLEFIGKISKDLFITAANARQYPIFYKLFNILDETNRKTGLLTVVRSKSFCLYVLDQLLKNCSLNQNELTLLLEELLHADIPRNARWNRLEWLIPHINITQKNLELCLLKMAEEGHDLGTLELMKFKTPSSSVEIKIKSFILVSPQVSPFQLSRICAVIKDILTKEVWDKAIENCINLNQSNNANHLRTLSAAFNSQAAADVIQRGNSFPDTNTGILVEPLTSNATQQEADQKVDPIELTETARPSASNSEAKPNDGKPSVNASSTTSASIQIKPSLTNTSDIPDINKVDISVPIIKNPESKSFNEAVSKLEDKIKQFRDLNETNALNTARELHKQLLNYGKAYFDTRNMLFPEFNTKCEKEIRKARLVLDSHRGWSEVIANILLALTGIGLLIKGLINIVNNHSFFFVHETDSSKCIKNIEHELISISSQQL